MSNNIQAVLILFIFNLSYASSLYSSLSKAILNRLYAIYPKTINITK